MKGANLAGGQRLKVQGAQRLFSGKALVRTRATTQHDSYERLASVRCSPSTNNVEGDASMMSPVPGVIKSPQEVGIDFRHVAQSAQEDSAVAEFSRFYLERRAIEVAAAGSDERKRRKLEDEFTPRLQMTVVGLEGRVHKRRAPHKLTLQLVPLSGLVTPNPRRSFKAFPACGGKSYFVFNSLSAFAMRAKASSICAIAIV